MSASAPVVIDLFRREAALGRTVFPVAPAGDKCELQIGGPTGPVLRPLRFRERTLAVAAALHSTQPREALCETVWRTALVRTGEADMAAQQIIALTLAGAGSEIDTPGFAESALLVARASGWSYDQLADAEATEVDRLARHLSPPNLDGGWNRLAFARDDGAELSLIRAELADDLLGRGAEKRNTSAAKAGASGTSFPSSTATAPASATSRVETALAKPRTGEAMTEPPRHSTPPQPFSECAWPTLNPVDFSKRGAPSTNETRTGAPTAAPTERRTDVAAFAEPAAVPAGFPPAPGSQRIVTLRESESSPRPDNAAFPPPMPRDLAPFAWPPLDLSVSFSERVPSISPALRAVSPWPRQSADSTVSIPIQPASFATLLAHPEVAESLAAMLHNEADLRGLDR